MAASADADQACSPREADPTGDTTRSVRLASIPGRGAANPYVSLYLDALTEQGITFSGEMQFNNDWLTTHAGPNADNPIEAIQFHWPEQLWRYRGNSKLNRATGVLGLRSFLKLAKKLGVTIIWTVHNMGHHEGMDIVDRRGYRLLAQHADVLICHSHDAAAMLPDQPWAKGDVSMTSKVVVMPHGSYAGVYPDSPNAGQTKAELGLDPAKPAVCCVGQIRPYKGTDLAVEAVAAMNDVQLIIAGSFHPSMPSDCKTHWQEKLGDRLVVIDDKVSDQQFADYTRAGEAVLLPYRKITGSGVLLAAWTLGRGVIASDLGFFRELLTDHPEGGRLFEPDNATDFAKAIGQFIAEPADKRQQAAEAIAKQYAWDRCVRPVAQAIRQARGQNVEITTDALSNSDSDTEAVH